MSSKRAKKATGASPKAKAQKWVYLFADGKAEGNAKMRALLGGKGAGLAEMTNAGLPVPPGFTITTAACNAYFKGGRKLPPGLWDQVEARPRDRRDGPRRSASATPGTRSSSPCARVPRCRCPG